MYFKLSILYKETTIDTQQELINTSRRIRYMLTQLLGKTTSNSDFQEDKEMFNKVFYLYSVLVPIFVYKTIYYI
jgi:hypothetical protein